MHVIALVTPIFLYNGYLLNAAKEKRIIFFIFKNTLINVPLISLIFSLVSTYICYKPKELLADIYEMKYQTEFFQSRNVDVMGNVKEVSRIDILDKKKKEPKF